MKEISTQQNSPEVDLKNRVGAANEETVVELLRGDTLYNLAKAKYGKAHIRAICDLNKIDLRKEDDGYHVATYYAGNKCILPSLDKVLNYEKTNIPNGKPAQEKSEKKETKVDNADSSKTGSTETGKTAEKPQDKGETKTTDKVPAEPKAEAPSKDLSHLLNLKNGALLQEKSLRENIDSQGGIGRFWNGAKNSGLAQSWKEAEQDPNPITGNLKKLGAFFLSKDDGSKAALKDMAQSQKNLDKVIAAANSGKLSLKDAEETALNIVRGMSQTGQRFDSSQRSGVDMSADIGVLVPSMMFLAKALPGSSKAKALVAIGSISTLAGSVKTLVKGADGKYKDPVYDMLSGAAQPILGLLGMKGGAMATEAIASKTGMQVVGENIFTKHLAGKGIAQNLGSAMVKDGIAGAIYNGPANVIRDGREMQRMYDQAAVFHKAKYGRDLPMNYSVLGTELGNSFAKGTVTGFIGGTAFGGAGRLGNYGIGKVKANLPEVLKSVKGRVTNISEGFKSNKNAYIEPGDITYEKLPSNADPSDLLRAMRNEKPGRAVSPAKPEQLSEPASYESQATTQDLSAESAELAARNEQNALQSKSPKPPYQAFQAESAERAPIRDIVRNVEDQVPTQGSPVLEEQIRGAAALRRAADLKQLNQNRTGFGQDFIQGIARIFKPKS